MTFPPKRQLWCFSSKGAEDSQRQPQTGEAPNRGPDAARGFTGDPGKAYLALNDRSKACRGCGEAAPSRLEAGTDIAGAYKASVNKKPAPQ